MEVPNNKVLALLLTPIRYQLEPNELNRQELINIIAILEEYGQTF